MGEKTIDILSSKDQQEIYDLLKRNSKKYKLHDMYIGCLIALSQKDNPDRKSQAACSLRELIEHLPENEREENLQSDEPTKSLLQAVRDLRNDYKRACDNSGSHQSANWVGEIDTALQRYLRKSKEFFGQFERLNPYKKNMYESFLWRRVKTADKKLANIPRIFWKRTIDPMMEKWDSYRKELNSILHHDSHASDFDSLFLEIERFIEFSIDPKPSVSLRKTFDDIREIEQLIQRGETSD